MTEENHTRLVRRRHPLYDIWKQMIRRCHAPKAISYKNYGERGIAVCDRWRYSFETFVTDVEAAIGERPSKTYSLDRIDNMQGYEPGNIRWATWSEQCSNTRFNRLLTANGRTQTLEAWSKETGTPKSTLFNRILRGWSDDEVINTPVQPKVPQNTLFPPGGVALCEERGIHWKTVASRMRRGWTFERALSTPAGRYKGGNRHA